MCTWWKITIDLYPNYNTQSPRRYYARIHFRSGDNYLTWMNPVRHHQGPILPFDEKNEFAELGHAVPSIYTMLSFWQFLDRVSCFCIDWLHIISHHNNYMYMPMIIPVGLGKGALQRRLSYQYDGPWRRAVLGLNQGAIQQVSTPRRAASQENA